LGLALDGRQQLARSVERKRGNTMNIFQWVRTRFGKKVEQDEPIYIKLLGENGKEIPELSPQPVYFKTYINDTGMLVSKNSNLIDFGMMARVVSDPTFILQNKNPNGEPQFVGRFFRPMPLQPLDTVLIAPGDLVFEATELHYNQEQKEGWLSGWPS
jgi:hypothetical protein